MPSIAYSTVADHNADRFGRLLPLASAMAKHAAAVRTAATAADAAPHLRAVADYTVVFQDCGVTADEFAALVAAVKDDTR
jgi:hypothetical protein